MLRGLSLRAVEATLITARFTMIYQTYVGKTFEQRNETRHFFQDPLESHPLNILLPLTRNLPDLSTLWWLQKLSVFRILRIEVSEVLVV